ncbi:TRAP transporter small permease [Pelagerythrobacter marinus]|uniref:TRAP transporter small permease n=1 Tax=Pelagerythrobacter marinus TaxID=538382 RepID=UPI0020373FFF|nr:TRAP transporter small permease [Pelagerythrobacter marinus]USA39414.1 TRAP transporter small permease [Pelagerythrobacter marinus]WPZ06446.1 TRAP transporter small permease [Pelagerythrobacter marinus]
MAATIARWLIGFGAAGLIAMTAIIAWQVFGRFVLDSSPSWTEQASLILMIWYVMFASAAGVYEGFHIRIALLEERLGERSRGLAQAVALVVAIVGIVLLIYGAQLCWAVRGNAVPSLGISRAAAYVPLPIAGLLMTVFAIPRIVRGRVPAEESKA